MAYTGGTSNPGGIASYCCRQEHCLCLVFPLYSCSLDYGGTPLSNLHRGVTSYMIVASIVYGHIVAPHYEGRVIYGEWCEPCARLRIRVIFLLDLNSVRPCF